MRDASRRPVRKERPLLGDRGVALAVLATLGGMGMIAAGWIISGGAYLPDVLLQVGSSLVLVVPLVWLGWTIEVRLRRTEQRTTSIATELTGVRQAVARLDDVGAATRARLEESRDHLQEVLQAAEEQPTGENLARLMQMSAGASVVSGDGVRGRISGTELRLRLTLADDEGVRIAIEHPDGTPIDRLEWPPQSPADTVSEDVAGALTAHNLYPGDQHYDASATLRAVLDTVRAGIVARTGPTPRLLGPLTEIPGRQWAVAADGLYCLDRDYHIPAARLLDTSEDWRAYMLTKTWVDRDDFLEAYEIAQALIEPS